MIKLANIFDSRQRNSVQTIPADRMDRLQQSFRRRLNDSVEEVFYRACVDSDLRTAAGLFAVLEDMSVRRLHSNGCERRFSDDGLAKARAELDRCRELAQKEKVLA